VSKLCRCDRCGKVADELDYRTVRSGLFLTDAGALWPVDLCHDCMLACRALLKAWLSEGQVPRDT
jgi:hypothetical protein